MLGAAPNRDDMRQEEISDLYLELNTPPPDADASWCRRRGFRFERLLNALFERDGMVPRTSYRPKGEQVDGSFICDGRVFLLEAKWHSDPIEASAIYAFKGKIDGKLAGTLGLFISMSGYTTDCVDALVLGKELNVLLMDQADVTLAVSRPNSLAQLLRMRLREAAETGSVYRPSTANDLVAAPYTLPVEASGEPTEGTAIQEPTGKLSIVCEGRLDSMVLQDLAFRILRENGLVAEIRVVQTGGKQNLPRVANLFASAASFSTVILVADSDGSPEETKRQILDGVSTSRFHIITPDPSIETWLMGGNKSAAAVARSRQVIERVRRSRDKAEEQLAKLDLDRLRDLDSDFAAFYKIVKKTGRAPNKAPEDTARKLADPQH